MRYIEVLNNLKKSINEKGLNFMFSDSINTLKNDFGQEVSTRFLNDLSDLNNSRKKTKRVNYLIRNAELKTKRVFRFYKEIGRAHV